MAGYRLTIEKKNGVDTYRYEFGYVNEKMPGWYIVLRDSPLPESEISKIEKYCDNIVNSFVDAYTKEVNKKILRDVLEQNKKKYEIHRR